MIHVGYYDMILLDVDSKDSAVGMSSPPQQFLEHDMLDAIKSLLSESGEHRRQILNSFCPLPHPLLDKPLFIVTRGVKELSLDMALVDTVESQLSGLGLGLDPFFTRV